MIFVWSVICLVKFLFLVFLVSTTCLRILFPVFLSHCMNFNEVNHKVSYKFFCFVHLSLGYGHRMQIVLFSERLSGDWNCSAHPYISS